MKFQFGDGFNSKLEKGFELAQEFFDIEDDRDKGVIFDKFRVFIENQVQIRLEELEADEMREKAKIVISAKDELRIILDQNVN